HGDGDRSAEKCPAFHKSSPHVSFFRRILDEQSGHHNEKASRPLLQQLMRNGDAASAAPALTVVSGRRREIDPDLVIFLVMASSSPGFLCCWLHYMQVFLPSPRSNSS
ncbi:MAG TPA: hypothetical protein VEN78_22680, partial [Bradyrhizobium sp.]|nr:hypothetical protein [Bradyrhizobium sp.]